MAAMPINVCGTQQNMLMSQRRCPTPFTTARGAVTSGRNLGCATARRAGQPRQRESCVGCAAQLQQQTLQVRSEADVDGMTAYLDSLKWDANGLVAAIVQVPRNAHSQLTNAHALPCPVPCSTAVQVLEHSRSDEVLAVVQHVDTGELLMQAFADRAAISETLQTGLATFYSRSRKVRLHWI